MPIFRVEIDRKVSNWDRFTRYVEADTLEAAQLLGEKFEQAAEKVSPDDYLSNFASDDCGPWRVTETAEIAAGAPEIVEVWTAQDVAELTGDPLAIPTTYTYTVVESAGYEGERVGRSGFRTWSAANDWMIDQYGDPEDPNREKMRPDIRMDGSDGSQTYEC